MTDKEQRDTPTPALARARVVRMQSGQRLLLGIAGVEMFVLGLVAVYVSRNHLGTVTALAIGALFFALATFGLIPLRARTKEVEFDFADVIEDLVESASPEEAARIAAEVTQRLPPDVALETSRRVGDALEYRRAVVHALRRVAPRAATVLREHVLGERIRADALIRHGNRQGMVEIKYATNDLSAVKRQLEAFNQARLIPGRWLIVMNKLRPGVYDDDEFVLVQWRSPEDDNALRDAVRRVLSEGPTGGG